MCWDTKSASESVKGQKGHEAVLWSAIMEFSPSADAGGESVRLMLSRPRLRDESQMNMYKMRRKKAKPVEQTIEVETGV